MGTLRILLLAAASVLAASAAAAGERGGGLGQRTNDGRAHFTLSADGAWLLNAPHGMRFDASGLVWSGGKLLTLSDRGPELYEIRFGTNRSVADLVPTPWFRRGDMPGRDGFAGRYDAEGVTKDSAGNLYICEESRRRVYRTGPRGGKVEALEIDWTPVKRFFGRDENASFEGIAASEERLYLANEREAARIIEVDLATLKVTGSFAVDSDGFAFGGPHYSDLSFFEGCLFVLDRNHRVILEVDPATKKVRAEYSYGAMEVSEQFAYRTLYPTGTMEGLAVDAEYFWMVTDNNGLPAIKRPGDIRPTLFRCKRPDKSAAGDSPKNR